MKTLFLLILFSLILSSTSWADCRVNKEQFTMADPLFGGSFTVTTWSFLPKAQADHVIFILPAIGGENFLDHRMGRKICRRGKLAVIVDTVRHYEPAYALTHLHIHQDSYLRASAVIRELIASLQAPKRRFGLMGTSLGGMLGAYVAGDLSSHIDRSVIIVGAGNVAGVLANSDQSKVVLERQKRMNHFGLSNASQYEQLLRANIAFEPLTVAGNVAAHSMFLLTGDRDKTVPTRYQFELLRSLDSPRHMALKGDHLGAILKAHLIHSKKIIDFL